jgi:uncharacterized RDD family membrane protein YckC
MSATYGHPSPDTHFDFYEGVAPKRLIAWCLDIAFTAMIALPFMIPFLLTSFLVFPLLAIPVIWAVTGFFYRWNTLSNKSATWGMRLMAIELRESDGHHLSGGTAFAHTAGTTLSFAIMPLQAISVLFMALGDKGQGLTDLVLGTAMLNRAA